MNELTKTIQALNIFVKYDGRLSVLPNSDFLTIHCEGIITEHDREALRILNWDEQYTGYWWTKI